MTHYTLEFIRSFALVGHGTAGKTSLTEALLHAAGQISAKGSVDRGNTVCDFDAQEKEAGHSLNSALVHFKQRDSHFVFARAPQRCFLQGVGWNPDDEFWIPGQARNDGLSISFPGRT